MRDSESGEAPPSSRPAVPQPELSGQQNALYVSLAGKDTQLAAMYMGGLIVLRGQDNPDALALAAHAMREMLEKLPAYLEVPMPAHRELLGSRVRELQDAWSSGQKSECNGEGRWQGVIDPPLRRCLQRVDAFFQWLDGHMPRRRAEVSRALRTLEPSGRGVPPPLETLNVARWESIREFFVSVSHHRRMTTQGEFQQWLDALERFLLERMRPRTFAELDKLDDLIRAGEGT